MEAGPAGDGAASGSNVIHAFGSGAATSSANTVEQLSPVYEKEQKDARERIRQLREKLVFRSKELGRWKPFMPASVDVPKDPAKAEAEKAVFKIITGCLFDPTTLIPLHVQDLHKKIMSDPAGERYEAALGLLGLPGPEPVVHKLASISFKFGPADFSCLRIAMVRLAGRSVMYITRVDRPALCRLTGLEDPDKLQQQQQQQQAGFQGAPSGPGGAPGGPPQLMGGGGAPGTEQGGGGGGAVVGMPPMGPPMGPGGFGMGAPGAFMGGMRPGMPAFPGGPPMMGAPPPPPGAPMGLGLPPAMGMGMGDGMPPPPDPKRPRLAEPPPLPMGIGMGMPMGPPPAPARPGGMGGTGGTGMASLEDLLGKRSVKEKVKEEKGAQLLDILAKPSAKESAKMEQFRSAGGPSIREHCPHLTKEECRRANNSPLACHRLHFVRVVQPHTDVSLGNCSYLDTCRNMRTCKYVHYQPDLQPDVPQHMAAELHRLKASVPKYLAALPEPQWINCDVRSFDMTVLGKFGVIMTDPPWEIHQDLPYGTMKDEEMLSLNIGCLQDEGVIFVWVTGRAMELGRECLKRWGYKRVDELIWVKTNQLQRLIRTGRTGHWLNHSKEHCLVGLKGNPQLNRFVDCDVVVGEVRETSRKPDEMYSLLERLSPGTRKLEIFARCHNCKPGWVGLGNQLKNINVQDPELRARFAARYGFEPNANVDAYVN